VLLPNRKDGLRRLEKALSAQMLDDCVERLAEREVELVLPRFTSGSGTVDMRDPLRAFGVTLPFDPVHADFSGINGRQAPDSDALFISAILHAACIEANEEGTEAAAATGLGVMLGASDLALRRRPIVFRADHPFLFAIRDRQSGAILLLGRVADPTSAVECVRGD
jgi:serpin B